MFGGLQDKGGGFQIDHHNNHAPLHQAQQRLRKSDFVSLSYQLVSYHQRVPQAVLNRLFGIALVSYKQKAVALFGNELGMNQNVLFQRDLIHPVSNQFNIEYSAILQQN